MNSSVESIARAILRVFREQRKLAVRDKVKFGDWHHTLARELEKPIAELYLAGLKKAKGDRSQAADLAAVAKQRSLESAVSVNRTTSEWLEQGRDPKDVFSPDRAASIALTEWSHATHEALALVVRGRKGKLRWVTKRWKKMCKECKALNGKVVRAGQPFTHLKDGTPVYAPGLHPSCYCRMEEVK